MRRLALVIAASVLVSCAAPQPAVNVGSTLAVERPAWEDLGEPPDLTWLPFVLSERAHNAGVWVVAVEAHQAAVVAAREAARERAVQPSPGSAGGNVGAGVWDRLAECESGGDWDYNGSSGFDGGLQFHPATWTGFGGGQYAPYAWGATKAQQIAIAERVLAAQGWRAWPACSLALGLR